MAGKKLILAMTPFLLLIILGSIFVGTYYRETSLAHEQLAAMDQLEKFGSQKNPNGDYCHLVAVYATVNKREDAERLMSMLRELNISVSVYRGMERHLSMRGAMRLKEVKRLEHLSEENGWPVSYFNHSRECLLQISKLQRENRIIAEHIDSLSPESREVLLDIIEENERVIEETERDINEWAEIDIFVDAGRTYTPLDFHDLSSFLATWGVIFGGAFLAWWVLREGSTRKRPPHK
ncbi:hypothetical protein A3L11_05860 [Thermococcus siculi]|uniref:Uncharacterized protein n=1 Tax=Thermococcus siculi TaxID=72803 RepID=A0A2Z2MQ36_9EURY|nr:hypothetical protein [Thermococcus siculi]ASJ08774.1 hypothetical protein A3L11_05860 [Thermococcus siculi]